MDKKPLEQMLEREREVKRLLMERKVQLMGSLSMLIMVELLLVEEQEEEQEELQLHQHQYLAVLGEE